MSEGNCSSGSNQRIYMSSFSKQIVEKWNRKIKELLQSEEQSKVRIDKMDKKLMLLKQIIIVGEEICTARYEKLKRIQDDDTAGKLDIQRIDPLKPPDEELLSWLTGFNIIFCYQSFSRIMLRTVFYWFYSHSSGTSFYQKKEANKFRAIRCFVSYHGRKVENADGDGPMGSLFRGLTVTNIVNIIHHRTCDTWKLFRNKMFRKTSMMTKI